MACVTSDTKAKRKRKSPDILREKNTLNIVLNTRYNARARCNELREIINTLASFLGTVRRFVLTFVRLLGVFAQLLHQTVEEIRVDHP